jgi:hypothetical protein
MHHSFGFINVAPLVISQNIPGPPLVPNFHNYLAIQNLYTGSPNFISKIAPIASRINVGLFRELCQGFHDQQIFDLIQFGFPLDLDKSTFFPNLAVTNHGSALQFPSEVQAYFSKEINLGSIFGPFPSPPLQGFSLQSSYDCSEGRYRAPYYSRSLFSVAPPAISKHFG